MDPASTEIYTLSLHDALPICWESGEGPPIRHAKAEHGAMTGTGEVHCAMLGFGVRSEEHTSELQSHHDLVCRLLLEIKKRRFRVPEDYASLDCYAHLSASSLH